MHTCMSAGACGCVERARALLHKHTITHTSTPSGTRPSAGDGKRPEDAVICQQHEVALKQISVLRGESPSFNFNSSFNPYLPKSLGSILC